MGNLPWIIYPKHNCAIKTKLDSCRGEVFKKLVPPAGRFWKRSRIDTKCIKCQSSASKIYEGININYSFWMNQHSSVKENEMKMFLETSNSEGWGSYLICFSEMNWKTPMNAGTRVKILKTDIGPTKYLRSSSVYKSFQKSS